MLTDEVSTVDAPPATPASGWDDFAVLTPVPPDESFWRKHNGNLEMPTSLLLSLLILSGAFATFAFLMLYAIGRAPEKPAPTISLVDGGGSGNGGLGSKDAGESGSGLVKTDPTTPRDAIAPPEPAATALPEVTSAPDPSPTVDVGRPTRTAAESTYGELANQVTQKMTAGQLGKGNSRGQSGEGPGGGPLGTGADLTKQRSLRWVMKFDTFGGRDYLDQLHALGAVILVPVPGSPEQFYLFRDLKNPRPGTKATDAEMLAYESQVTFSDAALDTLAKLAPALNLNFTPTVFHAVFPKGVEIDLAEKERAYRGLRPDQIGTTQFRVVQSGGAYRMQVVAQTQR